MHQSKEARSLPPALAPRAPQLDPKRRASQAGLGPKRAHLRGGGVCCAEAPLAVPCLRRSLGNLISASRQWQQPSLERLLTLVPAGSEGSLRSTWISAQGPAFGAGGREAGKTVFLQAAQMGVWPQTAPPAWPLCVLSSGRSDYLELVHLLGARPPLFQRFLLGDLDREDIIPAHLFCLQPSDGSIRAGC